MALNATSLFQQDLFVHNNTTNNIIINNNDDNNHNINHNNDLYSLLLDTYSTNDNNIIISPFYKDENIIPQDHQEQHYYHNNEIYPNDFNFLENQLSKQFDDWNYCSDNNYLGIISNNNNGNDGINLTNYDIPHEVGFCTLNNNYYSDRHDDWGLGSSPDTVKSDGGHTTEEVVTRPRRRRAKVEKKKEDIENQRMTHIVVERNRRKQMNEYLNVLKSLMPDSYVQRGDQASIVGGAINFVKELEQNLHCLSAKKHLKDHPHHTQSNDNATSSPLPFQEFFTFPQYSSISHGCSIDNNNDHNDQGQLFTSSSQYPNSISHSCNIGHDQANNNNNVEAAIIMSQTLIDDGNDDGGGGGGVAADVEVTMVESHANLKIRLKWTSHKMLSKVVSGLICLRLTVLHLNVNTAASLVFYSFSLKVEDDSKLGTVDEIAKAVYDLLGRIIQEDQATFIC
ncbi:hypothetical protein vseg_009861 [Gypsophila vaccaria]